MKKSILNLKNKKLKEITKNLYTNQITHLNLKSNKITILQPKIKLMKNLQILNLKNNYLKFLPAEILNLKLSELKIENNPFLDENEIKILNGNVNFDFTLQKVIFNSKIGINGFDNYNFCSVCNRKGYGYQYVYTMVYYKKIRFPVRYVICSYFCIKKII